ncbi:AlpA family phage regulatory protein [Pseudoalteromonas sp. NCCP-2140]|uniref:helix-turn-helix transcriptional regulator n=1 Tax=Pseudoalteromonas sp. NCCP-2140 TaxID=2942288 RepID=UPI002040C022|nr:AlpA family phage regulatory protein [Pseudoalteromonas sp. NCCP-2140]GKW53754.1 AlpA family phage regulatory protein [Pseudoalteromonas sp. NCCP-2140]
MSQSKLINIAQVRQLTGISTASIYRLMASGMFPNQVRLFGRKVMWLEEEVNDWIEDRIIEAKRGGN